MNNEKESVAAHCWGCMITADYLLEKLEALAPWKYTLNREKIYSLIIYHDLIEAETWDVDIDPVRWKDHNLKHIAEAEALKSFPQKLPQEIQTRFLTLLAEYEKRESLESKFVKLVDIVDCLYLIYDKKIFYKNWSEAFYEEKRRPHFEDFPELLTIHEDLMNFYRENNYFKNA